MPARQLRRRRPRTRQPPPRTPKPDSQGTLVHPDALRNLLADLAAGRMSIDAAVARLATLPFERLEFATIDHHRTLRCGFPEVIFGQGKSDEQIGAIFARLAASGANVLATRVRREAAQRIQADFPKAEYDASARALMLRQRARQPAGGHVAIVAAGTSDLPVAEEARVTVEMMDVRAEPIYDVGVAGIHRLLAKSDAIREATACVVVAGMEGALPSVVGGLVESPVIAVPTSVGYGASFGGIAALLGMLNSCAPGVSVVNIDNGFGGGYQAALIARLVRQEPAAHSAAPTPGPTADK